MKSFKPRENRNWKNSVDVEKYLRRVMRTNSCEFSLLRGKSDDKFIKLLICVKISNFYCLPLSIKQIINDSRDAFGPI